VILGSRLKFVKLIQTTSYDLPDAMGRGDWLLRPRCAVATSTVEDSRMKDAASGKIGAVDVLFRLVCLVCPHGANGSEQCLLAVRPLGWAGSANYFLAPSLSDQQA